MTKDPSRKVMKFRHLLGCDTIVQGEITYDRCEVYAELFATASFYIDGDTHNQKESMTFDTFKM